MKFDNLADYAEMIGVTYGVISSFKNRGYALYAAGSNKHVMPQGSLDFIEDIITFGPEEEILETGIRYLVLPLVVKEQQSDPKAVFAAMKEMILNGRAPYFLDLENMKENGGAVKPVGVHLIDSIYMEPLFLYLVVDSRFTSGKSGNIEIPLPIASDVIHKQMARSFRKQDKTTNRNDENAPTQ